MGFEKRFAQYHLNARPPAPLVPRQLRLEVAERISAEGQIVTPLDEAQLIQLAGELKKAGVEAVAIGFCTPMPMTGMKSAQLKFWTQNCRMSRFACPVRFARKSANMSGFPRLSQMPISGP